MKKAPKWGLFIFAVEGEGITSLRESMMIALSYAGAIHKKTARLLSRPDALAP
jgi:hypothetical protein